VGKTTVATGLMAALASRGHAVGSAKIGPDFIDPGYHALATGRPSRNLDAWMCGEFHLPALASRAASGCDLLLVEGVMGLFDGAGSTDFASTAHVARLLDTPVILVVDAAAMSGSVAALVHGYRTFDPRLQLAGVILNRVGSRHHAHLLREALAPLGVPVLGVLHRDDAYAWRDRHLGLVPVVESRDAVGASLQALSSAITAGCDLAAIVAAARRARPLDCAPLERVTAGAPVPVAVAAGPAFSFMYPDNLEALGDAGAELIPFDPLDATALPAGARGLVAGGGFPEVYAAGLSANAPLLADVRSRVRAGLPTWAECGGLLWLGRSLDDHPMAGVVDAAATMTTRLTLGYRAATLRSPSVLGPAGTALRGHEFHYSTMAPAGDALDVEDRGTAGFATPTMLASYLHQHLAVRPDLAQHFVAACAAS
jgi:cobyrinic acid a,c-diamide synthase